MVSVPSIRPCDTAALLAALQPCGSVITVEEHNVNGGLGSLVAEVLAEAGVGVPCSGWDPGREYAAAADRGWMRQYHGFDAAAIVAWCKKTDGLNARCVKRGRLLLQCASVMTCSSDAISARDSAAPQT